MQISDLGAYKSSPFYHQTEPQTPTSSGSSTSTSTSTSTRRPGGAGEVGKLDTQDILGEAGYDQIENRWQSGFIACLHKHPGESGWEIGPGDRLQIIFSIIVGRGPMQPSPPADRAPICRKCPPPPLSLRSVHFPHPPFSPPAPSPPSVLSLPTSPKCGLPRDK